MFLETLTDNWSEFIEAFWMTIRLTVAGAILALVLGVALAVMRVSPVPILRAAGTTWVNLVRNTPLTLIFILVFFGLPKMDVSLSPYKVAVVSLGFYTAAFICEAVRSGINSVAPGQAEAARAVGMTFTQSISTVVLPQALRSVVPPMASVLIALTKNTTIAAGFGVSEPGALRQALSEENPITGLSYEALPVLVWVALGFILLILPMSIAQQQLERRWRVSR
ncbi:MAG: polar amino acid transporter, inner rane subunit [Pseudonocardiales bacterium]|nr:polar amino acid transporter, inner rane subunit [Jatrophihabitantaceae bacterium]MCW2604056.1 polar amino acid transporter, inner rane subunit [Pseudonocardiales bacterium]